MLCSLLAACGGGGSSGGSGGSGGAASGESSGGAGSGTSSPTTQIRLDAANAGSAASLALEAADELGTLLESFTYYAHRLQGGFFSASRAETCDNGGELTYLRTDANGSSSLDAGDGISATLIECDGVSGDIRISLDTLAGGIDAVGGTANFTVDLEGGETIFGEVEFDYSSGAEFSRWEASSQRFSYVYDGTGADDFSSFEYAKVARPDGNSVTYSGSVTSTRLGGSLSFETADTLDAPHGEMPTEGSLRLSGSGSGARVQAGSTNEEARIDIDADGNSQYETMRAVLWDSLFAGRIFEVDYPVFDVAAMSFSPDIPVGGQSIRVDANAINRHPRPVETLSYSWSVNGELEAGETGEWLSPNIIRRGDTLAATVTLSDGVNSLAVTHSAETGNAPPSLQGLLLSPEAPDTTDPIEVSSTGVDPDGDPLEFVHEWLLNGEALPGHTGASLPPEVHEKGDEIEVTVTVTDGIDSYSAWAGRVEVQDSLPALTVDFAPTSAGLGELVSFTANIEDADGDPVDQFDFLVETGPNGMAVDPVTGVVTWTPDGPLFGPEREVHWSIRADGVTGGPAYGSIRVSDPGRDYPWHRVGSNVGLVFPHQQRIGDFDSDGDNSVLVATEWGAFEYEWTGTAFQAVWSHPFAVGVEEAPPEAVIAGDIDADGHHEIFLAGIGAVAMLDGFTRRIETEAVLEPDEICVDLAFADLNADGRYELVCAMGSSSNGGFVADLVVYDADSLTERWRFSGIAGNQDPRITVGNVDGDPQLEIVHARGKVFDGSSYALQWDFAADFDLGFGDDTVIADADGDGSPEIIAVHPSQYGIRGYDAVSQTLVWEFDGGLASSADVADVDPAPGQELIVGRRGTSDLVVYSFMTDEFVALHQIGSFQSDYYSLTAGDVDNDGAMEIVLSPYQDLLVVGLDPGPVIESPVGSTDHLAAEPPYRGGVVIDDGDGTRSVAFIEEASHYIDLAWLTPETGAIAENIEPFIGMGADDNPAIAAGDYDCDSLDEMLISTSLRYYEHHVAYDPLTDSVDYSTPLPDVFDNIDQDLPADAAAADLTGDGCAELVTLINDGRLKVIDIGLQTEIWSGVASLPGGFDIEIADLEGDGDQEVVISSGGAIEVFGVTTSPFALASEGTFEVPGQTSAFFREIELGDSDSDGVLEIFALYEDWAFDPPLLYQLDANLTLLGSVRLPLRTKNLLFDDSAPPPRRTVLIANRIENYGASFVAAVDLHSGATVWRSPNLIGYPQPNSLRLVDLDDGEGPRISLGTSRGMLLTR